MTVNVGFEMSGSCSTPSRLYDAMPSTTSAIITIAAKTGLLIETFVIHMARSFFFCVVRGAPAIGRAAEGRRGRREPRQVDAGVARAACAGAGVASFATAGLPSLTLSNLLASTGVSGGTPDLIST